MGKIFDALQKLEKEEDRLIFESDKIITETKFENKVKTNKELKTNVLCSDESTISKNLIIKKEEKSLITDQFRILRTQVLKKCRELNKRSLLVTSAMPQEGKTTISSNLAVGISQCINEKAILLDFDLRKPNISSLFNINGRAGILEYLIDGIDLSTIIYTTEVNNMLLIPAGKSDKHPSDIVSAKKVEQLLDTLKS